ncbi:hypothetical protein ACHQM5_011875 [Ranunculus cassubicifolius]
MSDVKKWSATYTKHIKQKRKVYQDGVLELRCSNGTDKVLLYDDSGKVLGSKFVKKDELVGSGETLTFDGYLVDIGDLDWNCEPLADLNGRGKDVKSSTEISDDNVASVNRPSVRYNIKQEWHALYTSQKTQKAKKYHDGILRLVAGASTDRKQVFLYDDSQEQLDSRYLKKDEVVECGVALIFDGYLVDIGDLEESSKSSSESSKRAMENIERFQVREKNDSGKDAVADNSPSVTNKIKTEWDVLYTTQKTQKTKKYHDGILQLHVGAALRRQVTLLNEDGTTLSSKYLNSSEDVRTGTKLVLASHLVEVGEARISQEGELQNDKDSVLVVPSFSRGSNVDMIKLNTSGIRNNCVTDGPRNNTSSENVLRSDSGSSEKLKANQISTHDASQILFTLKKPTSEKLCPVKEPVVQQSRGSFIDILEESPEDIMVISQSEDIHKLSCPSPHNGRAFFGKPPYIFVQKLTLSPFKLCLSPTKNYSLSSVTGLQVPDFFLPDFSENTETLNTEVSGGNDAYPKSSNALKRKANELSHANDFPSFDLGF